VELSCKAECYTGSNGVKIPKLIYPDLKENIVMLENCV
jgi:hypothetical protein